MYKEAEKNLWFGRVDSDDKEESKRWFQKIEFLPYPFEKKDGISIFGFECDEGVRRNQGRIGSFFAPNELKKAMGNFAWHLNSKLYDAGSLSATSDLELSQKNLALHVRELLHKKHFPVVLGGGHETAYGNFMGLFDALKDKTDIAIINFDSHFDLRSDKLATSGTPFYQISKLCQSNSCDFNYFCLGISSASNTRVLFDRAKSLGVSYINDTELTYKNFDSILEKLSKFLQGKKHIYISIDTDVFSSFLAPSVSAQSGRGIRLDITYDILSYLFKTYTNKIKLVDFTEFNPKYDIQEIGKKNIARLVYDVISLVDKYINI